MKKSLVNLSLLSSFITPALVTIACSTSSQKIENVSPKLLKELEEYVNNLKVMSKEEIQSKGIYTKYINYLINLENSNGFNVKSWNGQILLEIDIPFVSVTSDIMASSIGRYVVIPHGGHSHRVFRSWQEMPPTKKEIEDFIQNQGSRKVKYYFSIKNDQIDYENVLFKNIYVNNQYRTKGEVVNLNNDEELEENLFYYNSDFQMDEKLIFKIYNNSKHILFNAKEHLSKENWRIELASYINEIDYTNIENWDMTDYLFFNLVQNHNLYNKKYNVSNNLDGQFAYNFYNKGSLASDLHLEVMYDLSKAIFNSKDLIPTMHREKVPFGIEYVYVDSAVYNWWETMKPHDNSSLLYADPNLLKNFLRSYEDQEIFWNSLDPLVKEEIEKASDDYKTNIPQLSGSSLEIPFIYYYNKDDNNLLTDNKTYLTNYAAVARMSAEAFYTMPKIIKGDYYNNAREVTIDYNESNITQDDANYKGRKFNESIKNLFGANFNYQEDIFIKAPSQNKSEYNFIKDINGYNFPLINVDYAFKETRKKYYIYNNLIFKEKNDFLNLK